MTSKKIVREIVEKIFSGELSPNDKLPSENQIAIKYDVSRIMATKAYVILKQIGAVYSKPKKGFFISEYFSGILRSIDQKYGIQSRNDKIENIDYIKHNVEKFVSSSFKSFSREHNKYNKTIIKSKNWINQDFMEYQKNKDIVSELIWSNKLTNAITFLNFENFRAFGKDKNLVITNVYYAETGIAFVQKAVVKEAYFKMIKNEWSI